MNTVQLNYKAVGEGLPVVILHGLFGSLDNWQTIARSISEKGFRVVTVDLRNHGKSPHTDEMNHRLMANDVRRFIETNELQGCVLVGHSMGGKTAMVLAMDAPELIKKLVVVDIAPKPYTAHHHTYFDAMLSLEVHTVKSRRDASEQLGKTVKNKAIRQFLLKNLDRTNDGYEWKFNLQSLHKNYEKLIDGLETEKSVDLPTLFISGQLSDYISRADVPIINQYFPNNQIEVISNSGHWVHAEQPEAFKKVLIDFLEND